MNRWSCALTRRSVRRAVGSDALWRYNLRRPCSTLDGNTPDAFGSHNPPTLQEVALGYGTGLSTAPHVLSLHMERCAVPWQPYICEAPLNGCKFVSKQTGLYLLNKLKFSKDSEWALTSSLSIFWNYHSFVVT